MGNATKAKKLEATKKDTDASSTKEAIQPKKLYVKNVQTGIVYHLLMHSKQPNTCFLRTGNHHEKFLLSTIQNGLVSGKWADPNEHEIKAFEKKDLAYFQELTYKLINRVLYAQLLLEIDDDLKKDFMDDNYMRGIIERSEKQCTRLITENMAKMYGANKEALFTFLNTIERVTKKLSTRLPHEFLFFEKAIDKCIENPEAFMPDNVEMVKLDDVKN